MVALFVLFLVLETIVHVRHRRKIARLDRLLVAERMRCEVVEQMSQTTHLLATGKITVAEAQSRFDRLDADFKDLSRTIQMFQG